MRELNEHKAALSLDRIRDALPGRYLVVVVDAWCGVNGAPFWHYGRSLCDDYAAIDAQRK